MTPDDDETGSGRSGRQVVIETRGDKGSPAPGAGVFGLALFLASLSMLFGAGIVGYLVIRLRADQWRPEGHVLLPWGIWVGTLLLAGCSLFVQQALNAIREGRQERLRSRLWITGTLALLYVAVQSWNWIQLVGDDRLFRHSLYAFTIFMLTGLHAAHVVGGLVSLAFVIYRATAGAYSWAYYPGVRYNAIYWHFLGTVWLVLVVTLAVGSL